MTSVPASPWRRRVAAATALATATLLATAGAAMAHVAVTTPDAVPGGEMGLISFRVPNESATATTVKVTIDLPTATPVAEVSVQSLPGWTITTTERSLPAPTKVGDFTLTKVPASVTWTADAGTSIPQGQFQIFSLTLDPVPNTATLTFGAVQTYSDGAVVNWNQPEPADGSEAEHPAPVLHLTANTASPTPTASLSGSPSPAVTATLTPSPAPTTTSTDSGSTLPLLLAVAALLVAVVALVVALTSRKSRT